MVRRTKQNVDKTVNPRSHSGFQFQYCKKLALSDLKFSMHETVQFRKITNYFLLTLVWWNTLPPDSRSCIHIASIFTFSHKWQLRFPGPQACKLLYSSIVWTPRNTIPIKCASLLMRLHRIVRPDQFGTRRNFRWASHPVQNCHLSITW